MKHIFVVNPAAGKGRAEKEYLPKIQQAVKKEGVSYEIHRTINIGEGETYVRRLLTERKDPAEIYRFYACGGDGTLNEVVNAIMDYPNVEAAFIPAGTGNDFARNFEDQKAFRDISRQIRGTGTAVDLIRYQLDQGEPRYCVNMLNIGFDCHVVMKMEELRKIPFIRGTSAYISGVGLVLLSKKTLPLTIQQDENPAQSGDFLMMAVGNGKYSGGGFKGLPDAEVADGLMDISIVKDITRRQFAGLVGKYKKGTHLQTEKGRAIVDYSQCKKIRILDEETFCVAVDGEIRRANQIDCEIILRALFFSVPESQ